MPAILRFTKFFISLAVALSTLAGYLIFSGQFEWGVLLPFLGVYLLASGSSGLNQYQERDIDANMERTRRRPLPSGEISEKSGLMIIAGFFISGIAIMAMCESWWCLGLGILNAFWYNGIYTPMKRISPYAVVVGSVIGAIPPMIGWVGAGGDLLAPQIVFIASFLFIWQIPHFWILLFKHGKDYTKAGLSSMTAKFDPEQLKNITFAWMFATGIFSLFFAYFGVTHSIYAAMVIVLLSIWMMLFTVFNYRKTDLTVNFKKVFIGINSFVLFSILTLVVDSLVAI